MKNSLFLLFCLSLTGYLSAQTLTPESLWTLKRVSPVGITDDGQSVVYSTTVYDIDENDKARILYKISLNGGKATQIKSYDDIYTDPHIAPDGKSRLVTQEVKLMQVSGQDFYPEKDKSNVYIYDNLMYRHWDHWEDGKFSHLFIQTANDGKGMNDLMKNEPYDCPQTPFGGPEDYTWSPDGKQVVYVAKKEKGTAYAISTNTDIYSYDVASGETTNLSDGNKGYDTHPVFHKDGTLAYLQMDEPGYEADKNDLIVIKNGKKHNLTADWDGTVMSFLWSDDGSRIYFNAPVDGTRQLFEVAVPSRMKSKAKPEVKQLTKGQWDVRGLVGISQNRMVISRTDMNHAAELFVVNLKDGSMTQLTHENDAYYNSIKLPQVEKRMIPTTDGKMMLTWIIYPPDFDRTKKYPTLLYCQGGPQSPLSQFYSFRWNFSLMASQGYIVVAPNRRGMPGHGVEWNEQISGDWGGQNMQDYLAAIDAMAKQPFVDENRLGCVGASYGGYSAFYLAGIHKNRFKSFIAHDGVFNLHSMYGTTEELFFVNKDLGGPYWDKRNEKVYRDFNPVNKVGNWNTPMLIIQGGKDFRVPIGQGLEAFTALQVQGIKSKLLYFPEENHWILSAQNGIIWQREFFKWLEETL